MDLIVAIAIAVAALGIGLLVGYTYRKNQTERKIDRTEEYAKRLYDDAVRKAEDYKKEKVLEAKEEILKAKAENDRERAENEKEMRERRNEIQKNERRLIQREETLDKKANNLEIREETLNEKYAELARQEAEVQELKEKELTELERIASLTKDEAKQQVIDRVQKEAFHDAAASVREIETQAKEEGEKKARNIIALAIQKCAADHVAESTVSVISLPNDDMKGRIIGREGRNIRARIEEMVEKARKEVDNQIREAGENAVFETNQHGIHHELVKLLGRLRFRTSYGQNVLKHSIEVSHLAGLMAAELGADVQLAKRAGLLHDIGKAVDHESEGTHVTLGAELARKYHENNDVVHCIMAHHNDVEPQTVEAVLVQAADAISAARPGARRESIENYIKRLEKLEEIANSFDGVDKSYAIQSGREVRIMVKPEDVTDEGIKVMAKEIAKRIEEQMEYPGQIRVNVIRETRSTEYAK